MRTPRIAAVATILALTTALAACGGDDGKDSDSSDDEVTETVTASPTETATTEATTAPTDASVTPMDPTDTSGEVTQEQLDAALLTAEDLGAGFVLGEWTSEDSPPPCDPSGTPVDTQIPPAVEGGVEINTADGQASLQEELAIYDTEALAAEAFGLGSAGLGCTTATLPDGTTAEIGPAQDVTAEVNTSGIGSSTAWEISGDGFEVVLVATLAGRVVMACTFANSPDADTSTLPNPIEVAEAAFAKALAN